MLKSERGTSALNTDQLSKTNKSNYQLKKEIWMKKGLTAKQAHQMIFYGRLYK